MYEEHDPAKNKLYAVWNAMKQRCNNPKNARWEHYGKRGIRVCEDWKSSFNLFREWALANGYKEGLTLDRINNDGNYEPANCRWTTYKEQNNNCSRNVYYEYAGEKHTPIEWAEIYGLNIKSIYQRMERYNISFMEALFSVGEKRERLITYKGKTQNLRQWADELNISYTCLINRLDCLHLSVKEAFERPYKARKPRGVRYDK